MTEPLRTVTAVFSVKMDTSALKSGNAMVKRVTNNLKVLAGAAGVGLAVRGLARFTNELTRTFDQISKGARTVNFTRQAFQEWENTIELAGGSERSFSKYAFFLQRGIGEAVNGLKTYSDAFKQLGLSPRELQKLAPEAQFEKVFRTLGKVEDQTKRNALAQRLLGRGGRELTVAMKEGFEAHEKNRKELQRLGGVIKDELLIRSEAFQDRVIRLTKAFRGFKARALDQILNIAEPIIDWFTELAGRMSWLADNTYMLETALMFLKGALVIVALWVVNATWPFLLLVAALVALFLITEDVYAAMQGGASVIAEWYKAWTGHDLAKDINALRDALSDLISTDVEHWMAGLEGLAKDAGGALGKMADVIVTMLDAIGLITGSEEAKAFDKWFGETAIGLAGGKTWWQRVKDNWAAKAEALAPSGGYTPLPGSRTVNMSGAPIQEIEMNIEVNSPYADPYNDGRRLAESFSDGLRNYSSADGY